MNEISQSGEYWIFVHDQRIFSAGRAEFMNGTVGRIVWTGSTARRSALKLRAVSLLPGKEGEADVRERLRPWLGSLEVHLRQRFRRPVEAEAFLRKEAESLRRRDAADVMYAALRSVWERRGNSDAAVGAALALADGAIAN